MEIRKLQNTIGRVSFLGIGIIVFVILCGSAMAQLDESWTLSVGGRTVTANADGSFQILNVPAPDQFGPGGPGTAPDFVSDDFVRLTGFKTVGGVTEYVYSEPFRINQGQTFTIKNLTFTSTPVPLPQFIRMTAAPPTLTAIGATSQLTVTATMADGSTQDVTSSSAWTVYRSSNPNVATVDADGLVTAQAAGSVFITASNTGAAAVAAINISPGDSFTTVEGFIFDSADVPVTGVTIDIMTDSSVHQTTSGADGMFSLPGVPSLLGDIFIAAVEVDGTNGTTRWATGPLSPMSGGITDAGVLSDPIISPCVPIPSDIVSWWPGEGNANDMSGTNHGSLVNGTTFEAGLFGQAFSLDGLNDYVDVTSLADDISRFQATVELWMKPNTLLDASSPTQAFFANWHRFYIAYENGAIRGQTTACTENGCPITPGFYIMEHPIDLLPDVWYHVALVFDSGNRSALYFNGQKVREITEHTGLGLGLFPSSPEFSIGRIRDSGSGAAGRAYFNGVVDEVSVYNRVLTDTEILNLSLSGKCL